MRQTQIDGSGGGFHRPPRRQSATAAGHRLITSRPARLHLDLDEIFAFPQAPADVVRVILGVCGCESRGPLSQHIPVDRQSIQAVGKKMQPRPTDHFLRANPQHSLEFGEKIPPVPSGFIPVKSRGNRAVQ